MATVFPVFVLAYDYVTMQLGAIDFTALGTVLGTLLGPGGAAWLAVKHSLNGTKANIAEIKESQNAMGKDIGSIKERVSFLEGSNK